MGKIGKRLLRRKGSITMTFKHREWVNMGRDFSLLGALQFSVVVKEGLREHHKLLDIGCGPLRGGKFFINYLSKGNYCGVEPNRKIVEEAIVEELGKDINEKKNPAFIYFDAPHVYGNFYEKFDYILAHSVFTHMPIEQIDRCVGGGKIGISPQR